jgi:hypothetical protein
MPEAPKKPAPAQNVSPVCIVSWSQLTTPDTKFKEDGEYYITALFENEEAIKPLQAIADAVLAEKRPAYIAANPKTKNFSNIETIGTPEEDENGELTGRIRVKFKTFAKDKNGEKKSPPMVVDAKKNILTRPPLIGKGSKVRVAFFPAFYANPKDKRFGVTFYLNAVQIVELVTHTGGGGADAFAEEEGFVGKDETAFDGSEDKSETSGY